MTTTIPVGTVVVMRRNIFAKAGVTPEQLRLWYEAEGQTDAQIGATLGVTDRAVAYFRRKHGIPNKPSPLEALSDEELWYLYEEHSDSELADRFGVSKPAIRRRRHQAGIPAISKTERVRRRKEAQASVEPVAPEPVAPEPVTPETLDLSLVPEPLEPKVPYRQTEEYRQREAARARVKRAKHREQHPAKTSRVFTCGSCGKRWETSEPGNFRTCSDCKQKVEDQKRVKTCSQCGETFRDETQRLVQKYCNEECRRRAKVERSGKFPPGGFLADQERLCEACGNVFTPNRWNHTYCSEECRMGRLEARTKVCPDTGEVFFDDSPKNNRRYVPERARERIGVKVDPGREPATSDHMEAHRKNRVRSGDGGRIDDISTLKKHTSSWWGRVSETIFAVYRPKAQDMVLEYSNRSPYDFDDLELGKVEVRGMAAKPSPQGRPMWAYATHGLRVSCDHAFLVGYSADKTSVEHLWLVPSEDLPESLIRLAPGSQEYRGGKWDVTAEWGLMLANGTLKDLHDLPEVKRPEKYAWMDDPEQFGDRVAWHRGRKGEFLYLQRYPNSRDMNRELGPNAPFDFTDLDGMTVNAKVSKLKRRVRRSDKWSFCLGNTKTHQCDIYSCLCLAEDGKTVLSEYRIPASVWGDRRTIHIYASGGQWEPFKVG